LTELIFDPFVLNCLWRSFGASNPNARGLEQEPGAPLGFVDPVFKQARRRDVAMLISKPTGLAQVGEGRCDRYATEQRDELTPSHVLSSSQG